MFECVGCTKRGVIFHVGFKLVFILLVNLIMGFRGYTNLMEHQCSQMEWVLVPTTLPMSANNMSRLHHVIVHDFMDNFHFYFHFNGLLVYLFSTSFHSLSHFKDFRNTILILGDNWLRWLLRSLSTHIACIPPRTLTNLTPPRNPRNPRCPRRLA